MHRRRNGHGAVNPKRAEPAGNGSEQAPRARQRALCVAALAHGDDLAELAELLRTAGVAVVGELFQRRERPHPNTYLGAGKVEEAKAAARACDANVIACDDELSPRQERNLEEALGLPVIDRTAIILDIFASHAGSAEGKLQVELAQLQYNLARMRGLWSHLERLGGGIGTRGPGETQIETDRRLARDRISTLRRRLEHVKRTRAVQRTERERAALPTIALVGYTNAGKSTLLNALSGADVSVRDRLFHTLDPTTRTLRAIRSPAGGEGGGGARANGDASAEARQIGRSGRPTLITDTVGFISKLPHELIDAFAATLEETRRADLLVHVLDASVSEGRAAEMQYAVEQTLDEIGAGDRPRLLVLNKVDLLDDSVVRGEDGEPSVVDRDERRFRHPDAVLVSAVTGEGLAELGELIERELSRGLRPVDLLLPYADGGSLAELHELAGEVTREDTAEGVRVRALLPAHLAERFARFAVAAAWGRR
jgi:GTPase